MTKTVSTTTPVFALHASASGPSQWHRLSVDLAERHELIAIDLKERLFAGPHNDQGQLEEVARFAIDTIEDVGQPVHLVGHSFGGAVSLKVAALRPDLIVSLTIYEPTAFFLADTESAEEMTAMDGLRSVAEDLRAHKEAGRSDLGIRQFIAYWNGADFWDHLPESTHRRLAATASSVVADFAAIFAETAELKDFAALSIPTLILSGMESPMLAQRISARLAATMPGARLAILPGLNHMAPLTDPDWVNPRICQHIAEIERNAARVCWPKPQAA
ncbi:MAG: alpha/beta hydrolase [Pseudomonadota bacterium]